MSDAPGQASSITEDSVTSSVDHDAFGGISHPRPLPLDVSGPPASTSALLAERGEEQDKIEPLQQTSTDQTAHLGPDDPAGEDEQLEKLEHEVSEAKKLWKFRLRPADDEEPQDWWFASTAIPLLAATIGPLANVMSIAALVTPWRNIYNTDYPGVDEYSYGFDDPKWCVDLNAASLVCGVVGNLFLLFNFTRRVRYIIALPMTVVLWFTATGILIGITYSMNKYAPPIQPSQTYSQGFWHGVIAAVLYLASSMLLMINMLGYFLGHYTQHFELSDDQRTLILQTMMFFIWLAGFAGIFAKVCGWSFVDALYFCDVTVLTVGFGDLTAPNDVGRGLVFPFSVGGIIILGLVISSIRRFTQQLGQDKVIRHHKELSRAKFVSRAVTNSMEAEEKAAEIRMLKKGQHPVISVPFDPQQRTIIFDPDVEKAEAMRSPRSVTSNAKSLRSPPWSPTSWISNASTKADSSSHVAKQVHRLKRAGSRKMKILILREEKDRFEAMRSIQLGTKKFKQYLALTMSVIAFGLLWCVGAVAFWHVEQASQELSYFEALYFCYVSLLTIGYGDLAPRSNAGKPFFIVWSLFAVPTMTLLVSDMGDTVVASYKRGTFRLGDWTVLPKQGFLRAFLESHPRLLGWIQSRLDARAERKRLAQGFAVGPDVDGYHDATRTVEQLAAKDALDEHDLARRLTIAIRRTADDLKLQHHKHYSYEEWVEFTRLIRFTKYKRNDAGAALDALEDEDGLVEWDWIGADSPMMAEGTEPEWILDRLCESLDRYMRHQVPPSVTERRKGRREERLSFSTGRPSTDGVPDAEQSESWGSGLRQRSRNAALRFNSGGGRPQAQGMSSMKAILMNGT